MPASTPIYEFPYPCPDETVTLASFANLANAIDTKLLDLSNQEQDALARPHAEQTRLGFVVAGAGVNVLITGAGSTYTIPEDGIYIITVTITVDGGFSPTVTGGRFIVHQSGVGRFGAVLHEASAGQSPRTSATGAIVGTAGQVIETLVIYTGIEPSVEFDMTLTARMIVRLA